MIFVLIPHLKVQTANLHSAGFLVGGAPLMAASLLTHALARELGCNDQGVALLHHDRQDLGEWVYGRFYPQQRRGATFIGKNDYSSKNKYALSLQPTATAHLQVSLIMAFDQFNNTGALEAILRRNSRFAGGQIVGWGSPQLFENAEDLLDHCPNGFFVQDRQCWLTGHMQAYGLGRIEALTDLLARRDETRPWLSATVLGYALLEAPTARAGSREGYPHAYAEPLVGLVQYVTRRQILEQITTDDDGDTVLPPLLWTREWTAPSGGQPDFFTLQQH